MNQTADPLDKEELEDHEHEAEPCVMQPPRARDRLQHEDLAADSPLAGIEDMGKAAGKVAVAAMLATTLSGAPADYDAFQLPDAVPIVQVMDVHGPDAVPDQPDDQVSDKSSIWEKVFKILKYVLLALALVACIAVAVVNGCASCAGQAAAPAPADSSSSSASAQDSQEG